MEGRGGATARFRERSLSVQAAKVSGGEQKGELAGQQSDGSSTNQADKQRGSITCCLATCAITLRGNVSLPSTFPSVVLSPIAWPALWHLSSIPSQNNNTKNYS